MSARPSISFEELLRYEEEQSQHWRALFARKPHLLKMEASPTSTVADFLVHLIGSEYRMGQRLLGETMTPDRELKLETVEQFFELADKAREKLLQYLANSTERFEEVKSYPSHTLGEIKASPKKMMLHAVLHSSRHWAQLARIIREHGVRIDWNSDVIFSKIIE